MLEIRSTAVSAFKRHAVHMPPFAMFREHSVPHVGIRRSFAYAAHRHRKRKPASHIGYLITVSPLFPFIPPSGSAYAHTITLYCFDPPGDRCKKSWRQICGGILYHPVNEMIYCPLSGLASLNILFQRIPPLKIDRSLSNDTITRQGVPTT